MFSLKGRLLVLLLPTVLASAPSAGRAQMAPMPPRPGNILAPGAQLLPPGPGIAAMPALPGNILAPGAQLLPAGPQPRAVPFVPQNPNLGPASLPVLQQQLIAVRRAQALTVWQRRQMAGLMREQLQLGVVEQQLALWRQQPLNPADGQQLAALENLLTTLQQQNLLQQLAIVQP